MQRGFRDGHVQLSLTVSRVQAYKELSRKNAELRRAPAQARQASEAAISLLQAQQHEQDKELRALLLQAQQDVAASRALTVRAESDQQMLSEKVCVRIWAPEQRV